MSADEVIILLSILACQTTSTISDVGLKSRIIGATAIETIYHKGIGWSMHNVALSRGIYRVRASKGTTISFTKTNSGQLYTIAVLGKNARTEYV